MAFEHAILVLLGIGAIGATFVGFSGVVVVFGERAHGEWLKEDRLRLITMIMMSLASCFLSFVPLVLSLFGVAEKSLWAWSSMVSGLAYLSYQFYAVPEVARVVRVRKHRGENAISVLIVTSMWVVIVLQALNATGTGVAAGPGIFVVSLLMPLLVSGIEFLLLVMSPIRKAAPAVKKSA